MFGYGALELQGRSIDPLFSMPALQRKRFERTLRDNPEAGEAMPVELNARVRTGHDLWRLVSSRRCGSVGRSAGWRCSTM